MRRRLADVRAPGPGRASRAGDVAAQPQAREAGAAVGPRRLGLQPVEDRQRQLARAAARCSAASVGHVDDRALEVVDHRPVHEADVAGVGARREELPRRDAPERPQVAGRRRLCAGRPSTGSGSSSGLGVKLRSPISSVRGLRRPRRQQRAAPERAAGSRARSRTCAGRSMVWSPSTWSIAKQHRHRLHVVRLGRGRRARLAGVVPRLEAGDVLGAGQRQQLAGLGGVDHVRRPRP